ncbi:hypothetical protein LSUE1_G000587 [Lachnellula suecica]|uniref:Fungal calcium binding protein domain-containing protein n=1 Tax=Lachnellula suecica TaxID=602035 RepID=A0A8T9CG56_9HELO|nr:hypothetical protein LSUE1_G000587 [Lachnellula suecica]
MRISVTLFTIFLSSVFAAALPCDVESDNCRAVINASACFNEYMSGSASTVLNCLAGTDGAATPKVKMCACTGCVAPVMLTFLSKNNVCT